MRFLADMGISLKVVDWLRHQGHEATHLRDEGLQRMLNGEIFARAASEDRVVLTFDLDFGEIAALSQGRKPSVLILRLQNARASHVIDRLSVVLPSALRALERGAIVIVEEARHRVRELPSGGP